MLASKGSREHLPPLLICCGTAALLQNVALHTITTKVETTGSIVPPGSLEPHVRFGRCLYFGGISV